MASGGTAVWIPYCGVAPTPGELLWRWNLDPLLLAALASATALVVLGPRPGRGMGLGALAVLAVIFVSPLCALSSALFLARTIHHLLLIALAAPLLALALPRSDGKGLAAATFVQAAVFWAWHAPAAYALALSHDGVYWLMQLSLLASAVWFWRSLRDASPAGAVGALLISTVQMGLLGALLTFAGRPLYAPHLAATQAWGLSPLQDQQAAGLVMWAPASAIYLAVALVILGRWIGPSRREARAA